jgi:hypothetical protein
LYLTGPRISVFQKPNSGTGFSMCWYKINAIVERPKRRDPVTNIFSDTDRGRPQINIKIEAVTSEKIGAKFRKRSVLDPCFNCSGIVKIFPAYLTCGVNP